MSFCGWGGEVYKDHFEDGKTGMLCDVGTGGTGVLKFWSPHDMYLILGTS